jgi:hypothetical protein
MAMGGFFLACVPDPGNFHVKSQSLPRQRMICVNVNIKTANLYHSHLHRALLSL